MPNPLPYYPFYPADWELSRSVQMMTLAQEAVFQRCLMLQWRDGYIPDDPAMVARFIGKEPRTVKAAWSVVRRQFVESQPGRLENERLSRERRKSSEKSVSASESAKRRSERSARASDSDSVSDSSIPESRARLPLDAPAVDRDTNPRTGLANSVESEFSALAESMYQQHPKAKDWPLVPAAMLRALERANGDGELIRYVHGLWCKTEAWREANARYCPALPKWLDDRGWEQIPDEYDYQYRKWLSERKQKNEQAQSIRNGSGR